MSKAEDRALERFPVHEGASKEWIESHLKGICSDYIEGYHQAEKDLELSLEDMSYIRLAFDAIEANIHLGAIKIQPMTKEYYQEVLKRFLKDKGYGDK